MKKPNKKQRDFSIRLKTSFAVQSHLEEINYLKQKLEEAGLQEQNDFIKIMEDVLFESLKVIFPKDIEA